MQFLGCSVFLAIVNTLVQVSSGVNLNRLEVLTRDKLLELDKEVSQFYNETYEELDRREPPVNYDEQLFKSIRSTRHTIVMNVHDFKYTNNETKWRSMGSKVDRYLCEQQLRQLVNIANETQLDSSRLKSVPLSIVNFLESSGQPGGGVLNGNFVWLGSFHSCIRSRIPASIGREYLGPREDGDATESSGRDIIGRYCVAHLKARSWPAWDDYFEDRLTLKRGICLPESCHSTFWEPSGEFAEQVDFLARYNLLAPFNGERYETSDLYCLPDEDSPHRRMDLGAKLFFFFMALWALLTVYMNIRYYKRQQAVQKLRQTVDIKMTINQQLEELSDYQRPDERSDEIKMMPPPATTATTMDKLELLGGNGGSQPSSVMSTPVPSGIDDDDSDEPHKLLRPFSQRRRRRKRSTNKANLNYHYAEDANNGNDHNKEMDLVRAFAFEANLNFLFQTRQSSKLLTTSKIKQQQVGIVSKEDSSGPIRKGSSSQNQALVKELQERKGSSSTISQVAVKSNADSGEKSAIGQHGDDDDDDREFDVGDGRRVNIDVLDGLKVIATSWIVWGHTMMFFFGLVVDLRFGNERMFDFTMVCTINTLQVVGLFYIITGCLLTYFSFERTKLKHLLSPLFWLSVLVGRYVRLIPAYALVFWFARHVAPLTGWGPGFYDYRTDEEFPRTACASESWWVMWTMSAADIKIPRDCIPQAWYLSDDFRTLLVLPAYVLLLAKSALLGYSAIFATFVYSTLKLVRILRQARIDYNIILLWHPHVYALMADRLHHVYTDSAVRMSTYLLGVILGHLLYKYERRQIRQWPVWFRAWLMKVAFILAACSFLGAPLLASPRLSFLLPAKSEIDSDLVVWLIPLFKVAMELSIATMILLLVTGGGFGPVRRILASRLMKILSNLSYGVFLTHIELMYKVPAQPLDSDYWHLWKHAVFFIATAHVAAFILHLFFEMPINNLSRPLFKKIFSKFN